MTDIKDFTLKELEHIFCAEGIPSFRAAQVFSWIYKNGASGFQEMKNLPQRLREDLSKKFYIFGSALAEHLESADGTEKFLFEIGEDGFIEAAVIPAGGRVTACLSTQAGCKFNCSFCASGMAGFKSNLSAGRIIEQLLYLKKHSSQRKITHLVFMGTGEPLDNYENVIKAIRIINSPQGLMIAARRITISTCGIIPGIRRLAGEGLQIELSVSLHAADERLRSGLMPVNKKYPLKALIPACKEYAQKTGRQVTFEYIMIAGVNSGLQNARQLAIILKGFRLAKVNLIPCNPVAESGINPPDKAEVNAFRGYLSDEGVNVTVRRPRGADIQAACGQLRLRYEKE